MLAAVVFCPQAPALVPAVGRGLDAEFGPTRAACRDAIRGGAAGVERVVLLGAAAVTHRYDRGSHGTFAPFGVPETVRLGSATTPADDAQLPASLTVGTWLLRDSLGDAIRAVAWSVAAKSAHSPVEQVATDLDEAATLLVVVGDGSARRSEKAPGYLDPRAGPRDARTAAALRDGDPAGLRAEPADAELLVAGSPAWDVAARLSSPFAWRSELLHESAPFGVGYFVALWRRA